MNITKDFNKIQDVAKLKFSKLLNKTMNNILFELEQMKFIFLKLLPRLKNHQDLNKIQDVSKLIFFSI